MSGHIEFREHIATRYGRAGEQWLNQLPDLVTTCAQKWGLAGLVPVTTLTYNYVLSGFQGEVPIMLKLRCLIRVQILFEREVDSLLATQQFGAVKLLAYDPELGALLLERIIPGDTLASLAALDDGQATVYAAHLLQQLHQAPLSVVTQFSQLEEVLPFFDKHFFPLIPFLKKARYLRHMLLVQEDYSKHVVLHGDFHHGNVLLDQAGPYIAIDPEGMIGDPGYDMAVFIRNPLKELMAMPNVKDVIINRIRIFSDLFGYDKKRLYQWCFLQAFTSAYWSSEDGVNVPYHVAFLAMLESIADVEL